jgi:glycosyltransferase involved in cell wall biosynthesis
MPKVHIVAPNIVPGDAIAQDALGMLYALRRNGHEAYLYASEYARSLEHVGSSLGEYHSRASAEADDILIYHHAIGWDPGLHLYRQSRNARIVKFHNVTPPHFFEGIHQDFVASCHYGIEQSRELAVSSADLWLADSEFNAAELVQLGAAREQTDVVPPFHDIDTIRTMPADERILREFREDFVNFLFVGRVAPNKGHLDLLDAFAYYHGYFNPKSRLFLVGDIDPRLGVYEQAIRAKIERLGLGQAAILTGRVPPETLKAYYLSAHAFVCLSHHEGFCVPLVEAMAFHIPCIAWASTGVATTLGRHPFLWEELEPAVIAECLQTCVENAQLAEQVVALQSARYQRQFSSRAVERRFLRILRPFLKGRQAAGIGSRPRSSNT